MVWYAMNSIRLTPTAHSTIAYRGARSGLVEGKAEVASSGGVQGQGQGSREEEEQLPVDA